MENSWTYRASVNRVVDGDTIDFEVDLGFNVSIQKRVRLRRVDTNEVYGVKKESEEYERGKRQSEFVNETLKSADEVIIETYKDDETGKYGRYLADVWVDGRRLADLLTEEFNELELLNS